MTPKRGSGGPIRLSLRPVQDHRGQPDLTDPRRRRLTATQATAASGTGSGSMSRLAWGARSGSSRCADAWPLDDELRATAAAWGIVPEHELVLV
jgi:hypothetical protein